MSHITTYTGNHFDPINPDPELINIVDIAHALPMICRGTARSVRSGRWENIAFCARKKLQPEDTAIV